MMIGENHHLTGHLTDNATLNKHSKVQSEAYKRELPILANHKLLDLHPPLP